MQIPFPKSIPLRALFVFLSLLLLLQIAEGTDPLFSVLMLVAQLAAAMAFNTLGGMSHVAGAFCLFSILPNVTVPEVTHAILLQPGSFNLPAPLETAGACAVFYLCLLASARMVAALPPPDPFVDRIKFSLVELRTTSFVAISFYVVFNIAASLSGSIEDGSTLAALQHFVVFLIPLSVVLASYVQIRSTNGRSSMNWYVATIICLTTIPGILGASKEGMLNPLMCWLLVCAAARFRFKRLQIAALTILMALIWVFVYPFSQNARGAMRSAESFSAATSIIVQFIRNPSAYPRNEAYDLLENEFGENSAKTNIIQRYSLLRSNGMLISADQVQGFTGIDPYLPAVFQIIPHFIWPNRPSPITTNALGHKAGFQMDANDFSTGISIGSPSLFFDLGGWLALIVYALIVFTVFFYILRLVVGKSTQSVWGLMLIGSIVLIAGPAAPSSIFQLMMQFAVTFVMLVAVLKIFGYVSAAMMTRPALD